MKTIKSRKGRKINNTDRQRTEIINHNQFLHRHRAMSGLDLIMVKHGGSGMSKRNDKQ